MDGRTCPVCRESFGTRGIRQHIIDFHLGVSSQDTWICGDCVFESYNFDEVADHALKTGHGAGGLRRKSRDFERKLISVLSQIQEALPSPRGGKKGGRPPSEMVDSTTKLSSHEDRQEMNLVAASSTASAYPPPGSSNNDDSNASNGFLEVDSEKRWGMTAEQISAQLERMDNRFKNQSSSLELHQSESPASSQNNLEDEKILINNIEGDHQYFVPTNRIIPKHQNILRNRSDACGSLSRMSISTRDTSLINFWMKKEEDEDNCALLDDDIAVLSQKHPRKKKQIKVENDEETRTETEGTIDQINCSFKGDHQYFISKPETGKGQEKPSINILARRMLVSRKLFQFQENDDNLRGKNISDAVQQILLQHHYQQEQQQQQQPNGGENQNHQQSISCSSSSRQNANHASSTSIFEQFLRQQIAKNDPNSCHGGDDGDSSTIITTASSDVSCFKPLFALPNSGDASSSSSSYSLSARLLLEEGNSNFQPKKPSPPRPTNTQPPPKIKYNRKAFTVVEKMRVLEVYDALKSPSAVARLTGIKRTNILTWIKDRAKIEGFLRRGAGNYKRQRFCEQKTTLAKFPNLEERLSGWIQSENRMVRQDEVRAKAHEIYDSLGGPLQRFTASKGWFDRFINRWDLQAYVHKRIRPKPFDLDGSIRSIENSDVGSDVYDGGNLVTGSDVTGTTDVNVNINEDDEDENDDDAGEEDVGDLIEDDDGDGEDTKQFTNSVSAASVYLPLPQHCRNVGLKRHHADGGNLPADLQQRLEAELERRRDDHDRTAPHSPGSTFSKLHITRAPHNPSSIRLSSSAAAAAATSSSATSSLYRSTLTSTANIKAPPLLQQSALNSNTPTISHSHCDLSNNTNTITHHTQRWNDDNLQSNNNNDGATIIAEISRQSSSQESTGDGEPEASHRRMNTVNTTADVKASKTSVMSTTASVSANISNVKPLEFDFEIGGVRLEAEASIVAAGGAHGERMDEEERLDFADRDSSSERPVIKSEPES